MKTQWILGLLSAAGLIVAGCGGPTHMAVQTQSGGVSMPSWMMNPNKGCGVGAAKIRGSAISMAQSTANSRASANLAGKIDKKVAEVIKDYSETGEHDGKDFNEELTRRAAIQTVKQNLQGLSARYDAMGGQMFAEVCLDPETFSGIFDKMNNLSKKARKALRSRAENAWADLDERTAETDE